MSTSAAGRDVMNNTVVDASCCIVCETRRRISGRRFCGTAACAQTYVRSCVFCRKQPAAGARTSNVGPGDGGFESALSGAPGFRRFCSVACRDAHTKRVNTPRSLRPVCRFARVLACRVAWRCGVHVAAIVAVVVTARRVLRLPIAVPFTSRCT